jgi:hypothetical protein
MQHSHTAQSNLDFTKGEYELYRSENERLKTQVADGIEKQRKLQQELVTVMEAYMHRKRAPKKREKSPRFLGLADEEDEDPDIVIVPWAL